METTQFKEYAELKLEERRIKDRIAELQPDIIASMLSAGKDKQPTSLGTFTLGSRRTWAFSEGVHTLLEQVEALKQEEKANGTATSEEKPELKFFINKD